MSTTYEKDNLGDSIRNYCLDMFMKKPTAIVSDSFIWIHADGFITGSQIRDLEKRLCLEFLDCSALSKERVSVAFKRGV